MESEIAGWLSVVFRFVHVLAAIMWIGNSILFTWMELNLIAPKPEEEKKDLLGHLDMLHGGGVFHLEKRVINPSAIPVPLHWFMWQSYTTWISGVLLLVSVFYIHGGAALVDATKTDLTGWRAITLSMGGIIGWWLIYDTIWKTKLKEHPKIAVPLTFALLIAAAFLFNHYFNGRAVFLQIGAMLGSSMSSNVYFHIIRNQKKFMRSLLAGLPHDMKYGKQAKLRSMHNHYMTFPVLFMMLSAHFPQLTSAERNVPILGVIIIALMAVKHLMNSRYYFKHWLASIFATFVAACVLIGTLLAMPSGQATVAMPGAEEGARLFVSQGCAACHQSGASQLAPDLNGVFNSTQTLADGSKVVADEAYLRDSISHPQNRIVKGYAPSMPALPLTEIQVDHLVAYLKSL
ncbi:MAG: urate hydroxylase PuuD [Verrucomicrobiota bacterium]